MPLDNRKIRQLRKSLHLTQAQAAEQAGFQSSQAWANIERRDDVDPKLSSVQRIAEVLGVLPCDIILPDPHEGERPDPAADFTDDDIPFPKDE